MSEELVNLFQFAQIQELTAGSDSTAIANEKSISHTDCDEKESIEVAEEPSAFVHDEDMTATYHEVMTEDYELTDTRMACIGNVDSGKVSQRKIFFHVQYLHAGKRLDLISLNWTVFSCSQRLSVF